MALLFSTPQITLTTGPDARLVRYVRTSVPYASMFEYELLHERVAGSLDQLGRRHHVLLIDMREAVMNTDPAFERAAGRAQQLLVRDFRRIAILVKTAIGALQDRPSHPGRFARREHLQRRNGGDLVPPRRLRVRLRFVAGELCPRAPEQPQIRPPVTARGVELLVEAASPRPRCASIAEITVFERDWLHMPERSARRIRA